MTSSTDSTTNEPPPAERDPDLARPKKPDLPPFAPFLRDKRGAEKVDLLAELREHIEKGYTSREAGSAISDCPSDVRVRDVRVQIDIREAPWLAVPLTGGAVTLHAQNRVPAAGGTLHWREIGPAGVITMPAAVNGDTLVVTPNHGGTATIELEHRFQDQTATATCQLRFVSARIQQAPRVAVLLRNAPAPTHLDAIVAPPGGEIGWARYQPGIARFGDAVAPARVPIDPRDTGVARAEVIYRHSDVEARGDVQIEVVDVTLAEGASVAIPMHGAGAGPTPVTLHAHGLPAGGQGYAWQIVGGAGAAVFQGGVAPGNVAQATLESSQPGTTTVEVSYTAGPAPGAVTARARIDIHVVAVTIAEAPLRVLTKAHGPANTLLLHAQGVPAGGGYGWSRQKGTVVALADAASDDQKTVRAVDAGTSAITVTYRFGGVAALASMTIEVAELELPAVVAMLHHGNAAIRNQQVLNAVFAPAGGTFVWQLAAGNGARFAGGALPGDVSSATVESDQSGTSAFQVDYTVGPPGHQVTLQKTVQVHVVSVTLGHQVAHVLSMAPGANTLQLIAQGLPANGTYDWRSTTPHIVKRFAGTHPSQKTFTAQGAGRTTVEVGYTVAGVRASASVNILVASLTVDRKDVGIVLHANGATRNTQRIRATRQPFDAGDLVWQRTNGNAARFFQGRNPGTAANVEVESDVAGTATFEVSFTASLAGVTRTLRETIDVHVVSVSIQPPAAGGNHRVLRSFGGMASHGWPARSGVQLALTGVGTPAHPAGVFTWSEGKPSRIRFAGGANPGNTPAINVETVSTGGTATFNLSYTLHGAKATTQVQVEQHARCSQVRWLPAVNPLGAAPVAAQAQVDCTHEATPQRPHGPGAAPLVVPAAAPVPPSVAMYPTVAPPVDTNFSHHHGGFCPACIENDNGAIFHWVDPDAAGTDAAGAALELCNQFRSCIDVWTAYFNAQDGNPAQRVLANYRHQIDNHIRARGWPWLAGIDFDFFRLALADTAPVLRAPKPKMFGVLIGRRHGGHQVKLRAISGKFPGIGTAQPNRYWSPELANRKLIHGATRGSRTYPTSPQANPVASQFGKCAASKLLQHALHLGLSIDSMAEIWIGETQNNRHEAQLQASCIHCRRYIGEALCESGGNARSDPHPIHRTTALPPNDGLH